jgi:hypothetical protein
MLNKLTCTNIYIKPYVLEEAFKIWEGILVDQKEVKGKV